MTQLIFLDVENGYYVAEDVFQAMSPLYNRIGYGHTGLTHAPGWEAYQMLQEASSSLGAALGLASGDLLHFTHDTTEATNLALLGTARGMKEPGRIIHAATEPLATLHCAEALERRGWERISIPVDAEGFIDLDALANALTEATRLVTISLVNAEVGTIQDMEKITTLIREKAPKALVHADLSDAAGKIPLSLPDLDIDTATISSVKLLGPRGAAALYVRKGVKVKALIEGSYSTEPLWPGDENVPAILGFAHALEAYTENADEVLGRIRAVRDRLMEGLLSIPESFLNGPKGRRAPDNLNVGFLHVEGEALTVELSDRGIYVSSGSACSRKILQPSHVLTAMGRRHEEAHGSILMKIHRLIEPKSVDRIVEAFDASIKRLRTISGTL